MFFAGTLSGYTGLASLTGTNPVYPGMSRSSVICAGLRLGLGSGHHLHTVRVRIRARFGMQMEMQLGMQLGVRLGEWG